MKHIRFSAIDMEKQSIAEFAQNLKRRSLQNQFDLFVGDCHKLPFDDQSFWIVTCQTLLIHVPDPLRVLREMKRVLKPGVLLIISEPVNSAS